MPSDLHEAVLSAVEVFCQSRVPAEHRDEIRLEGSRRGNSITLTECRAPLEPRADRPRPDQPGDRAAALRRVIEAVAAYCRDRNARWWPYDNIGPSASVDPPLAEVDADPIGIFWVSPRSA